MTSIVSQSTRSLSAEFSNKTSQEASKSSIFALFDQISQIDLPNIFYLIPYLYISFQWIDICIFDANTWDLPALLQDGTVSHITLIILYSVVFVITLFSIVFPIVFYKLLNRFMNWSMYLARFCIDIVIPVFLNPMAWEFGYLLEGFSNDSDKIELVIFLALDLVYFIIPLILYCLAQILISKSVYMSRSILYTWSSTPIIIVHVTETIMVFFVGIFSLLPSWTNFVIAAFHFLIAGYIVFLLIKMPFFQYHTNGYFAGLLTGIMIMDIFFIAGLNIEIRKIIIFPLIIVILLIFQVTFHIIVKKDAKLLQNDQLVDNQLVEEYFRDIGVDNKISYFLHIGLKERSDLFINFSIIKYGSRLSNPDCLRAVAVFPSQTSLLNLLYKQMAVKVDLSFGDKFMLFQVNRIKFLRQSSSSIAATEQLDVLKIRTRELRNQISGIWIEGSPTYSELTNLGNNISLCSTSWKDIIKNIPNSQTIRDEYVKYLIDVETNFSEACKQHYFSQLIGSGRSFTNDTCFRSLIYNCPEYLKNGIVDIKGNIKIKGEKKAGSSSNNSNSNKNVDSSLSSSLDAKMEESIGRLILKNSRMRLALQSALENKKSTNIKRLTFWAFAVFLIGMLVSIVVYVMFKDYLDDNFSMNERNMYVNIMQLYNLITAIYTFLGWARKTESPNRFDANAAVIKGEVFPEEAPALWNGGNLFNYLVNASLKARTEYRYFINNIAKLSAEGTTDVHEITGPLLSDTIKMPICAGNSVNGSIMVNLKTYFFGVMSDYSLVDSLNIHPDDWWRDNNYICMGFSGTDILQDAFIDMRTSLLGRSFTKCKEIHDLFIILEIAIPVCTFLAEIIPFTLFFVLAIQETKKFVKMMMTISDDIKQEATKSIVKAENQMSDQTEQTSHVTGSNTSIIIIGIATYVTFAAQFIVVFMSLNQVAGLNDKFMYVDFWCLKNSLRESIIADILLCTCETVIGRGQHPIDQSVYNSTSKIERSLGFISTLGSLRIELISGNDDVRPILGYDPKIDDLILREKCEVKEQNSTLHDMYSCGSVNQQISFVEGIVLEMSTKISEFNSSLKDTLINNLIHLVLAHSIPQLQSLDNFLSVLLIRFVDEFDSLFLVLFLVGLIISIIIMLMLIVLIKILQVPYDTALKVLKKIHPIGIVNTPSLMDYLLDRNSEKQSSEMNTTRAVLHNWNDAVLMCSSTGTIESVNSTVTKIIGYTPEQLLGQNISVIFNEDDKGKITQQIQFILNKQSAPYFEDHMSTISDTEQIVPCLTMMFGVSMNGDQYGDIASFVVILHDETELTQYQEQAENAKKQSEDLLYQILPRDIVIRLNQGEKDISFEVPSASVMFIDIVKFSEFSSNLTPSEIMGTLSSLFGSLDETLSKFSLITKIKLIGDVYMAASGLFSPEEPPQHHAEQLLHFGIESLQVVDEINVKMTTNLNVRIGMNSGGPLIAGVLGTDKPVFDIIGDTINVASRLQSTDIPNRVQISQGTYDLVCNMDFNIEPRGEIFLKGKGKSNAFLVRPFDAIGSCISSTIQ